MKWLMPFLWLVFGLAGGVFYSQYFLKSPPPVEAGDTRFEDFIMCTGEVLLPANRHKTEAIWLLDYRAGKLLGTVTDRNVGKILGWAEVDLVAEFGIKPRQNVHFMMTTGAITNGQAALYLAETTTGKMGIYTIGPRAPNNSFAIRRHDMVFFRQPKAGDNN